MKINFKVILLTLIVFTVSSSGESLFSGYISSVRNLWPKSKGNKSCCVCHDMKIFTKHFPVDLSNDQELKKVPAVQFELPVENEEFIKKGLEIIGSPRSSLDLCNHRVVQTLKKNCNQLNSEEIGKLAVMLLNCQLEVEGRSTFPCRPEMVKSKNFVSNRLILT